jgi:cobalt-zinc-cadmium efflux system membrane fusion protein
MKRLLIWSGTAVLLLGLAAGALWLAARSGWKPPGWLGFLAQPAKGAQVDAGLFCKEHGVPEKFCTLCHEELKSKLIVCSEHGLPEEICTICHPEVATKYGITALCKRHGLPERFCTLCNPALRGDEVKSDWCPKHLVPQSLCTRCIPEREQSLTLCAKHAIPEALCTLCRPELMASLPTCSRHKLPLAYCKSAECQVLLQAAVAQGGKTTLPLVHLASPDIAAKAGFEAAPVQSGNVSPTLKANGEVAYDETKLARVRARVAGVLLEVLVREGDVVEQGQTLAVIDSAELGEAKADYLASTPMVELWTKTLERNKGLSEKGVGASKNVLEAEAELRLSQAHLLKAKQKLRNWGLNDHQIEQLGEEQEAERNRQRMMAPLKGSIVRRKAVLGEAVEPTSELFTVADLSSVWVSFNVYEKDLRRVVVGQPVVFHVPDLEPAEFSGKVLWIDTEVNDRTRTVQVRAQVGNAEGLLRANMFGSGEIQLGKPRTSLLVPKDAVQWEGASFVVFVRKKLDEFEPRRVIVGEEVGKLLELAWADLTPGEEVVTTGSFLLKTEIQKGSIGAGCCGE